MLLGVMDLGDSDDELDLWGTYELRGAREFVLRFVLG